MEHKGAPHDVPALHLAAQEGHADVVAQLLAQGPTSLIDAVNRNRETALHCAARAGHAEIVEMLLAHSPAFSKDSNGHTALHVAVRHDEVVALLLAHKPGLVDVNGHFDVNVLHLAVHAGCEKVVARLLALRPSLADAVTLKKETALFFAAGSGHDGVVAQLLAHNPELVDVTTSTSQTVLHAAAFSGSVEVVARLLAHKPSLIEAVDSCDQTPLHCAAERGNIEVVAQLVAACPALANATDFLKTTPLFAAVRRASHMEFLLLDPPATDPNEWLLKSARVVEFLLPHTSEAAHRHDHDGNTLLHLVAEEIPALAATLTEKVLRMNPEALYVVNNDYPSHTPFTLAVESTNWAAFKLFHSKFALDDIFDAFKEHCVPRGQSHHQLGSVMKQQYRAVWASLLPRDLVDTVYEYLGFERQTTKPRSGEKQWEDNPLRVRRLPALKGNQRSAYHAAKATGTRMRSRTEVRQGDDVHGHADDPCSPPMQAGNEAVVSHPHAGRHGNAPRWRGGARRGGLPRELARGPHNLQGEESQAVASFDDEQAHSSDVRLVDARAHAGNPDDLCSPLMQAGNEAAVVPYYPHAAGRHGRGARRRGGLSHELPHNVQGERADHHHPPKRESRRAVASFHIEQARTDLVLFRFGTETAATSFFFSSSSSAVPSPTQTGCDRGAFRGRGRRQRGHHEPSPHTRGAHGPLRLP